jgi:hypothetical protein
MASKRCAECGAELRLRSASCPLCGAVVATKQTRPPQPSEVENYQSGLRELKEQLRKLREDAEAV